MNNLLEDIHATLIADAAIAALVSRRIYPDQASQGAAMPYIIYQEVSLVGGYNLAGPDGTEQRRLQFDAYAAHKADALTLITRVKALLNGKKQTLNSRTQVLGAFIQGGDSTYEPDERSYRQRLDLMFRYRD